MPSREFASPSGKAVEGSSRPHPNDGAHAGSDDDHGTYALEFVEHDAAHGVFRSPRPSITLDEYLAQQLRGNLQSAGEVMEEVEDEAEEDEDEDTDEEDLEDEGAVCTKVWNNRPSHTCLESDQDRDDSFDLIVEDNCAFKPTVLKTGSYKKVGRKQGHTVYAPVFPFQIESAKEQTNGGESEVEEESDDEGFEILAYPSVNIGRIIAEMN